MANAAHSFPLLREVPNYQQLLADVDRFDRNHRSNVFDLFLVLRQRVSQGADGITIYNALSDLKIKETKESAQRFRNYVQRLQKGFKILENVRKNGHKVVYGIRYDIDLNLWLQKLAHEWQMEDRLPEALRPSESPEPVAEPEAPQIDRYEPLSRAMPLDELGYHWLQSQYLDGDDDIRQNPAVEVSFFWDIQQGKVGFLLRNVHSEEKSFEVAQIPDVVSLFAKERIRDEVNSLVDTANRTIIFYKDHGQ